MLYSTLKLLIGSGLRLHFRRIETSGLQRLEQKRPTIIIANHTNALTDPLLLGALLQRRIHFYVRGDVFEHRLARVLFTHLGMLPIYRLQEGRDRLAHNQASHVQALRILQEGGALLIFAEGSSDEAKLMRPVKKGPFRLAAEAARYLPEPPALLPLGINYLEPEKPDTTAWLMTGEALKWPENWQDLPDARLSLTLMQEAEKAFVPLTLHAGHADRAAIAETLLLLQKNHQQAQHGAAGYFNFNTAKTLLDRLAAMPENSFRLLREKARAYQHGLDALGLEEKAFKNISPAELWGNVILSFPVWFAGVLFHSAPFALTRLIVRKKVRTKDFRSSIHILSATFLNIIWYLLWLLALSLVWNGTGALLLLLALASCGIISYTLLLPSVRQWRQQLRLRHVRQKRKEPFERLLSLRQELIDWLTAQH